MGNENGPAKRQGARRVAAAALIVVAVVVACGGIGIVVLRWFTPLPPYFAAMAKADPQAKGALRAVWRAYGSHPDLQKAFHNDEKGLLKWAIDDAKHGSGYNAGELASAADALIDLDAKQAPPMPDLFVQLSKDPQKRKALQAVWLLFQDHDDLLHAFANNPQSLLKWAVDDAKHGSGYSPKELGPYQATLVAVGDDWRNSLPDVLEREAQKGPEVRAAMLAVWQLYLDHDDLRAAFTNNPKGLLGWAIDDAKHGSHYQIERMGQHAKVLLSLEPLS